MIRPLRRSFVPRLERLEDRTVPTTLTVLNNLDSGPGSLRAVLAGAANGATITFAGSLSGNTITLTSGAIDIAANVTIVGPGAASLTVSGHNHSAIFDIAAGATVSVSGLTFTHGLATSGGAIDNAGTLTLRNDAFTQNQAWNGLGGGAILNESAADLTLSHVVFSTNLANAASGADVFGGALLNEGGALVANSTFQNNQALGGGTSDFFGGSVGGAIANTGGASLVVTGSTFTGNEAVSAAGPYAAVGGAIDNDAGVNLTAPSTAYISDSTFAGNQAIGRAGALASGGAIANQGTGSTMLVSNSTLTGNRALGGGYASDASNPAAGMGGGILNVAGATVIVDDSTLSGNAAVGGNHNSPGTVGALAGAGQGGGLLNAGATASVMGSTFTGNRAVGGTNDIGPGSIATGGAIENLGGDADANGALTVINSTLSNNAAIAGHGGPIAPPSPGTGNLPAGGFVFASFAAGGGIDNSLGGQASVLDSTLKGNQAIGGAAGSTQAGANAYGGGISVGIGMLVNLGDSSALTLTDSTLTSNAALGGTGGPPAVWAVPSAVAANLPSGSGYALQPAGVGGDGFGGGLAVQGGSSANISGGTIASNYARGGASGGYEGSAGAGYGGGVAMSYNGTVTFDPDTLVANNHASATVSNDLYPDWMGGPE